MDKWQYGIVIDAGSSGSRVHVYRWLNSREARKTENVRKYESLPEIRTKKSWTKKIHPGVSTFGKSPDLVGPEHLQELLDHALDTVPAEQVPFTPIFLLATAGVRLLPELERNVLLEEICSYTRKKTDFLLPDCDLHIQVIPGETEGLYGWVAANYLLGGFDAPEKHAHGKGHHTYGFLDMGGASAQIAFAPNQTEAEAHADDLKLLRLRNVNGAVDEYKVYVTTWLGFGVNEARRRYIEALLEGEVPTQGELPDPCLPNGLLLSTKGDIMTPDKINGKETHLIGTGKFDECLAKTYPLLGKEVPCENAPCLLNGVHAPAIDFDVNHFVGVSEYWHTTHEVFDYGHKDKAYDLATFQERVSSFCSRTWSTIQEDLKKEKWGEKVDEAKAAEVCFKANWVINVLHEGIGIPRVGLEGTGSSVSNGTKDILDGAREKGFLDPFQPVNKIDDAEVSWTLGKILLYASSEIPPSKTNNLPVGFGANVPGIPADFQFAGVPHSTVIRPNVTQPEEPLEGEGWRDTLFEGKTPKRIPGFILFLAIICIAVFLLCGKDRRSRIFHKYFSKLAGPGGRYNRRGASRWLHPFSTPKIALNGADEGLLERGMANPDDFELGDMHDDGNEDSYSDDSAGSKTGRTSGWATPRLRSTPKTTEFPEAAASSMSQSGISAAGKSLGLGINAMDRSGLFPRTESRERLHGFGAGPEERERGRRSRRGSPTRAFNRSPLMKSLAED